MPLRGEGLADPDDDDAVTGQELRYVLHPNVSIDDM